MKVTFIHGFLLTTLNQMYISTLYYIFCLRSNNRPGIALMCDIKNNYLLYKYWWLLSDLVFVYIVLIFLLRISILYEIKNAILYGDVKVHSNITCTSSFLNLIVNLQWLPRCTQFVILLTITSDLSDDLVWIVNTIVYKHYYEHYQEYIMRNILYFFSSFIFLF